MVEDPELPFPESTAAAEIHKAGRRGAEAVKYLFYNIAIGGVAFILGKLNLNLTFLCFCSCDFFVPCLTVLLLRYLLVGCSYSTSKKIKRNYNILQNIPKRTYKKMNTPMFKK